MSTSSSSLSDRSHLTSLSNAFSPGYLSSPAQPLQLVAFDGVAQVNAWPVLGKVQRLQLDILGCTNNSYVITSAKWNLSNYILKCNICGGFVHYGACLYTSHLNAPTERGILWILIITLYAVMPSLLLSWVSMTTSWVTWLWRVSRYVKMVPKFSSLLPTVRMSTQRLWCLISAFVRTAVY